MRACSCGLWKKTVTCARCACARIKTPLAPLHQMFIVQRRGAYIRPHRHRAREMMITLFAGEMSVMIFSDDGAVEDVVPMGDFASGKSFYCRIPEGKYYTQIIESGQAFFGEVLLGRSSPRTCFMPILRRRRIPAVLRPILP